MRAVLQDGDELERVRARIERNWSDKFRRAPRDYIQYPKDSGYRAVHFVVERDGRAIEVQLRTKGQQQWADAVESLDARLGTTVVNLKDGQGPPEILEYFSAAGELIFVREYGRKLTPELIERFAAARRAVVEEGYYRA